MRPNKMALWNEFLPSIEESVKPTTWSERSKADDKKGNIKLVLAILTGVFAALVVIY